MNRYRWAQPGDVNAFFGLMLDNLANIVLTVGLLATVFGFPATFAMRYMVPGTALGVLIHGLIQTLITFHGALNSWWTRIAIGLLLLVFIGLQNLVVAVARRRPG